MNHYTETKLGEHTNREITMLSPNKSEKGIVSLVVKDQGEVMFMDTNLTRLTKEEVTLRPSDQ